MGEFSLTFVCPFVFYSYKSVEELKEEEEIATYCLNLPAMRQFGRTQAMRASEILLIDLITSKELVKYLMYSINSFRFFSI